MKSILPFKRRLALLGAILLGYSAQAQVATTYNFSQSVGTYTAITGGTVLANASMGNLDEDVFEVTIPAFSFDGVSYTTLYISTNGYVSFGEQMGTYEYDPISGPYTYTGAISAFGTDLDDAGSGAGARNIRVEQVGTEFIIQWQNVGRYDVTGERISFQIRLNTTNNEIKIVYGGTITLGDNQTYPEVGLRGGDSNFSTNVNNREVTAATGAWVNSLAGTDEFSTCHFDSNDPATLPAAGTTFTWTGAPDISASAFTFTTSNGCYGETEEVSLVITNTGGSTIDFSVNPVTISADVSGTNPMTFAPITINTGTLAVNATQTVQLAPSYDMSEGGSNYVFDATITMTGDVRPANNDLNQSILNQRPAPDYQDLSACSGEVVTLAGTTDVSSYEVTLSNMTSLPIPDDDINGATSSILVSNAASINASDVTVTILNITHEYSSDITLTLIAPDGSSIDLAYQQGFGSNFINTTFSDAAADPIIFGDSPFTGSFQPEEAFSNLTGTANGTWQLLVVDDVAADAGVLNGWSISFNSPNSVVSYSWTPTANLSDASVSNPDATLTSTETYTVTVTDERGCTATDDVTVSISGTAPTVLASSDAIGNMICEGESVTLSASGTATGFTWNNSVTDGVAFEPTATAEYIVTGTDANNCSNSDTITIVVNSAPTVTASSDATGNAICEGESVTLTGGGTATSYDWDNSVVDGDDFEPASTTNYTVTGTDANGCTNTATITITVNPLPAVALSLPLSEMCVYHNALTLSGGSPASGSYSGTGVTSGTFNPATSGIGTFTITYMYTDANGCSDSATDNILVDACLGVEENTPVILNVFPNPGKGIYTISITDSDLLTGISIVDVQGKQVSFETSTSNGVDTIIDLGQAENGVYFLQATLNGNQVITRLVKQ